MVVFWGTVRSKTRFGQSFLPRFPCRSPKCVSVYGDEVLEQAFLWLKQEKSAASPNHDVWNIRRNWLQTKSDIQRSLINGTYSFEPLRHVVLDDGKALDIWSPRDTLVLKALQLALSDVLPVHDTCTHAKGRGGLKRAVRDLAEVLDADTDQPFHVMRTDVKSYYASIDHDILLDRLSRYIGDQNTINLISCFLKRSVEFGGTFVDYDRGISRGCALSPLLGAFYLHELDEALAKEPVFYIRYMDDIAIASNNKHRLRGAIAVINKTLNQLNLEKHPDKTFIGRASRGFDFLGYHFQQTATGKVILTLAQKTITNFENKLAALKDGATKAQRANARRQRNIRRRTNQSMSTSNNRSGLYEHDWHPRKEKDEPVEEQIRKYINRWFGWVCGGISYELVEPKKPRDVCVLDAARHWN